MPLDYAPISLGIRGAGIPGLIRGIRGAGMPGLVIAEWAARGEIRTADRTANDSLFKDMTGAPKISDCCGCDPRNSTLASRAFEIYNFGGIYQSILKFDYWRNY
jgi:hypothetical protein